MTSLTLYTLTQDLIDLFDQIDPETGEFPEEYGKAREMVANKAANVAAYIANRELAIEAMKARVKQVNDHIKAAEKRADWLRQYLCENMRAAGITEIQSDDALLKIKRQPDRDEAVEVFDESMVPAVYMNVPVPILPRPDKAAIKHALKAGLDVPGARIVKRDRLVIG